MEVGNLVLIRNKDYGIILDIDADHGYRWALIYWNAGHMTWEDLEASAEILEVVC